MSCDGVFRSPPSAVLSLGAAAASSLHFCTAYNSAESNSSSFVGVTVLSAAALITLYFLLYICSAFERRCCPRAITLARQGMRQLCDFYRRLKTRPPFFSLRPAE